MSKTKASSARQIVRIATSELLLDDQNPRLGEAGVGRSQAELTEILWKTMAADEVALSIAANGYFPEEPLLVIPDGKKWRVVEGNRRLTAVRVLLDEALQRRLGADLPKLSQAARESLAALPAAAYRRKEDLWQFFGFRHVNGPKPWDAYAKAHYVAMVHDEYNKSLDEIARSIGDRHSTVQRLYRGYRVLVQAETAGFDRSDRIKNRFYFSHLYTALDQPEFQDFLGITKAKSLSERPVPKSNLPRLMELLLWLYGSKSQDTPPVVRSQNPDLNTLRELIASRRGLSALRAGYDLDRASEESRGDDRRFRESLVQAKGSLQRAKATVATGFDGEEELLREGRDVFSLARSLKSEMEQIAEEPQRARH